MKKNAGMLLLAALNCGLLQAAVINTNNPATVAAFQSGATVTNFESISGVTPQTITSYTVGDSVSSTSFIFDQVTGAQFSVGGAVGTNEPAVYRLSGAIAGDAHSATNVLGPVNFDFTTLFGTGAQIEIFFPTKVSEVGFWLNPSLGNVLLIAADTNFAFSHETETTLESGTVTAGNFVGISRPTADIGGFKIIGLQATGFTVDDFTVAGASASTATPEPAALGITALGLVGVGLMGRLRNRSKSV